MQNPKDVHLLICEILFANLNLISCNLIGYFLDISLVKSLSSFKYCVQGVVIITILMQEGKELLGGKKLGDTRQMTKAKQKTSPKRANTMKQVVAEGCLLGLY